MKADIKKTPDKTHIHFEICFLSRSLPSYEYDMPYWQIALLLITKYPSNFVIVASAGHRKKKI